ncbi:MAG: phosphate regulon sensor histidine kinase PhoR [Betaproteobacteria bacterium]|nr:phosphate regulon sensor histidine kinase PhoR [Betaproteobacteria bacterium]
MRPVVWQGLVAPGIVAALVLMTLAFAGSGAALAVLAAGAAAIVGHHLWHLDQLTEWAVASLDAQVPHGSGAWVGAFAALHRRARNHAAHERDLRQVIERFQQVAAAMPDGIVVLDASNRIAWANPRAQAQLGLELAQDQGQPIMNLVRQPEFLRYLETGDYGESIVVASSRDAGRMLALQLVPFAADQKLLMSRDVTELEAVARMRRDFIATVSHELKTPLTVISGFIETLQDLDLDAGQRTRFLQLMQEQARNMQRLVADLLTLSALESEHNPLVEERFEVAPLLLELSADAKALSRGQHEVALDIGDAATVHGSRDELASAFGNLVSNAIRYTPPAGTITLGWRVDADGSGVFEVRDTGIGIAAEYLPRLTERFYRVDRSRSRATGGTGLGLAIVKHVALRHQAQLEIGSERGRGSVFAIRLPARRVERAPDSPEHSPGTSDPDSAKRASDEDASTSTGAQRGTGP